MIETSQPISSESEPLRRRRRPTAIGLARGAALGLIAALTGWLAFSSGGFFADDTAIATVALIVAALLLTMLPSRPLAHASSLGLIGIGALLLLTVWTLASGEWSGAPTRTIHEYQRALLYLLTFALFALLPGGSGNARWLLRLIVLALGVATIAGLAARLSPSLGEALSAPADERLNWPLGYWNALGLAGTMAMIGCLHLSSSLREPRIVRVAAAAATPALAAAIFLTLSRGSIVAGALGIIVLLVLGRSRGTAGMLLAVLPACGYAVLETYGATALTDDIAGDAASAAAGSAVAVSIAMATVGAALLRVAGLAIDGRLERAKLWRPMSRSLKAVTAGVAAAILIAAGLALNVDDTVSRQYERVMTATPDPVGEQRDRLGQVSANGRVEHWDVALQAWRAAPIAGQGAGTYARDWSRLRESGFKVEDAHSLYFETLGELGAIGLALLAVALLVPLVAMLIRRREDRVLWSAATALFVTWLFHAGIDWDWEMPALTLPVFALAGAACARERARAETGAPLSRTMRLLAGLGVLLLLITPVRVVLSQRHLEDAVVAFQAGRCGATIESALAANAALDSHPAPFELLGFCNVRTGRSELGVRMLEAAVRREPRSWELRYGLALVRGAAGRDPRPQLRRARRLNPLESSVETALERLDSDRPAVWRRESRGLPLVIPAP